MGRFISLALFSVLLLGCQEAQDRWTDVQAQASQLTKDTSRQALVAGKAKLVDLQSEIANAKIPPAIQKLKLESIKEQIAKVQAALDVQKLQAELETKQAQLKELKETTESGFQKANDEYQALQRRLQEAKRTYNDASERAREAIKNVKDNL